MALIVKLTSISTSSNFNSVEKQYKDNIFYTQPSADIGGVGVNIDRQSYNHTSKKTDAEKDSTKKALLNKDFRQSVNFAIDRTAYSAQLNGEKVQPLLFVTFL